MARREYYVDGKWRQAPELAQMWRVSQPTAAVRASLKYSYRQPAVKAERVS
jgi:hypothetical protein